jgi:hypothetical protein
MNLEGHGQSTTLLKKAEMLGNLYGATEPFDSAQILAFLQREQPRLAEAEEQAHELGLHTVRALYRQLHPQCHLEILRGAGQDSAAVSPSDLRLRHSPTGMGLCHPARRSTLQAVRCGRCPRRQGNRAPYLPRTLSGRQVDYASKPPSRQVGRACDEGLPCPHGVWPSSYGGTHPLTVILVHVILACGERACRGFSAGSSQALG